MRFLLDYILDQDRSSGVERGTLQCLDQRKLKMYKE